jgi:hypothetical protein
MISKRESPGARGTGAKPPKPQSKPMSGGGTPRPPRPQ